MQKILQHINQNDIKGIIQIMKLALNGTTNNQQSQVYQDLSLIQSNSKSYCCLLYIFCNGQFDQSLRSITGLTLKSFLSRNKDIIDIESLNAIKECLIQNYYEQNLKIMTIKSTIISQLIRINSKSIDYQILHFLVMKLGQKNQDSLNTITIFLEDLRFNNQNYEIFADDNFLMFMAKLIDLLQQLYDTHLKIKSMKCMNLLIYPLPQNMLESLTNYMSNILIPSLLSNNKQEIILALEGLSSIAESKKNLITFDCIDLLSNMNTQDPKIRKIQANLWIQIIDGDQEAVIVNFLDKLTVRLLTGLKLTPEDQYNMNEDNKLNHDQEEMHMRGGEFTLRKASVICIQKLSINHSQIFFKKCLPVLESVIVSPNWKESQCAILMLGIISPQSIQQLRPVFINIINFLITKIQGTDQPEIISTIFWTCQKLLDLIIQNTQIFYKILELAFIKLQLNNTLISQSIYSTLCQFLSSNKFNIERPILENILKIAINGITKSKGNALYNAYRLISQIFEKHSLEIQDKICIEVVQILCGIWKNNSNDDNVCCPLIQCLVLIFQKKKGISKVYAYEIFTYCLIILTNWKDRKDLLLRTIDLLSAVISLNIKQINDALSQQQILQKCVKLLNQETQIKNFTYGLLSDISQLIKLPKLNHIIEYVGKSITKTNIASCNNGLLCLTDIIAQDIVNSSHYVGELLEIALDFLFKPNIQSIIRTNFAKIVGRLCNFLFTYPQCREYSKYHQHIEKLHKNFIIVCQSLRVRQVNIHTDNALIGLLKLVHIGIGLPNVINEFHYVVDVLICYQNQLIQQTFKKSIIEFKQLLNNQQWNNFLNQPIFLPATLIKIQNLINY